LTPLLPGATIGVLGSGQLGRMLALAARRMGYRVLVFSPDSDSPAGQVADAEVTAHYEDGDALAAFAGRVDVVTLEFENIPVEALELLERQVPVRPGPAVLYQTQNREREKSFLAAQGLPHAATEFLSGPEDLAAALERVGTPAVLKTAGFGYDGKGQLLVNGSAEMGAALKQLGAGRGVLERFVDLEREFSVIVARSPRGELKTYPPIENLHRHHILDLSVAPAAVSEGTAGRATEMARVVAEALDATGVLTVEFFQTTGGELLVNEIAPRPHNSGHLTIEAGPVSQFEQQLRGVCGLPLGETEPLRPAAMANLLGDLWQQGEPDWPAPLAVPGVSLHLYGKGKARPGRKMGHLTALAGSADEAAAKAETARRLLAPAR
jgi:5-(carboxyamino)imidazole ribonucleotide synthase